MDGLLLINKPIGISSFDVIRQLRRSTGVRKIGHAGTLDPLASGLMLMLFGAACKQAQSLTKLDKTYLAEVTLGVNSTTGDAEGEKISVSPAVPTEEQIRAVLRQFVGEISQTPSIYSAIKIHGEEAYKRARRGESVDMPSRQVTIRTIDLLNYAYPKLQIETDVSSGTYIRSLAADIGSELGTGAYLSSLTRTRVGEYSLDEGHELVAMDAETASTHLISLGNRPEA